MNGEAAAGHCPGSSDGAYIGNVLQNVFGVQWIRGILGNNCYDYDYDLVMKLPCINYNFIGTALLGNSYRTDFFPPFRFLTEGEKLRSPRHGLAGLSLHISNVNEVGSTIERSSYSAITGWHRTDTSGCWQRNTKTTIQYRRLGKFPSISTGLLRCCCMSRITPIQSRTSNCYDFCMYFRRNAAMASGGYIYAPLGSNPDFFVFQPGAAGGGHGDLYLKRRCQNSMKSETMPRRSTIWSTSGLIIAPDLGTVSGPPC